MSSNLPDTPWQKATKSGDSGNCVEMRRHHGMIEVRDSKDPEGPALRFSPAEIDAWIDGSARGEFRHLTD